MDDKRWYIRRNYDYPVKVISPQEMIGQVVDLSDGGVLLCLRLPGNDVQLKTGQMLQMIVTTNDVGFITNDQMIKGEIVRAKFDEKESTLLVAVEIIGAWEDVR